MKLWNKVGYPVCIGIAKQHAHRKRTQSDVGLHLAKRLCVAMSLCDRADLKFFGRLSGVFWYVSEAACTSKAPIQGFCLFLVPLVVEQGARKDDPFLSLRQAASMGEADSRPACGTGLKPVDPAFKCDFQHERDFKERTMSVLDRYCPCAVPQNFSPRPDPSLWTSRSCTL